MPFQKNKVSLSAFKTEEVMQFTDVSYSLSRLAVFCLDSELKSRCAVSQARKKSREKREGEASAGKK